MRENEERGNFRSFKLKELKIYINSCFIYSENDESVEDDGPVDAVIGSAKR